MISVAIRSVFWLRFVLLGHKSVLVGYCGLISCAIHVCNGFVQPYVWFLLLIRVLIGSHVSSIKVLLVRFTRERFTIFKPTVRLKDRRADVPRGQRLFAFSVNTANYHVLTTTSIGRNFLEEKTNANSTSRHLLRKVNRRVPDYFGKSIAIGLPLTYRPVYVWVSDVQYLHILTPNNNLFYASRIHIHLSRSRYGKIVRFENSQIHIGAI